MDAEREIVIERLLRAPRELVFAVWTDPKHVDQWWGPNGFSNETKKMDLRQGGEWVYIMHGPDGRDFDNRIRYLEVVVPERLVYLHDSGKDNDPQEFKVYVTFEQTGELTKVTLRSIFKTKEARDFVVREFGAIEGGRQTLARLDAYLTNIAE